MRPAPAASSDAVRATMRANRSRDTGPERRVRSELHRLGLRFRKHARPLAGQRFTADAVFRRARVAVFVDGCWWHGCPEHGRLPRRNSAWWSRKLAANAERDRRADAALLASGWLSVRAWEHEDPARVALAVAAAVRRRSAGA